jgi:hypothetical protein
MESKYIYGIIAVVIVAGIAIYFAARPAPSTINPAAETPVGQQESTQPPSAEENAIAPITIQNGSVADIDLGSLIDEANDSASLSAQDGSKDAQDASNDAQTINSSLDSVNNTIQ